jgi:hypothetical protein
MPDDKDEISERIEELGQKSSQILLFLSFAMVSVATLKTISGAPTAALDGALLWWKWALLPVLVGVLPMKEFGWKTQTWYRVIRWTRFVLLWLAVGLIVIGVIDFFKA